MNSGSDLLSIGAVAARLSVSVDRCRIAFTAADIRPTMTLNGVPYFDRVQVGRIANVVGASGMTGVEGRVSQDTLQRQADRKRWQF